jgi:hypothetical protein
MTAWIPFENGTSLGATGSEGGTILRDELHLDGARVTLERTPNRYTITCGVYGWMVHTRFFSKENHAVAEYEEMKPALVAILSRLPDDDEAVEAAAGEVASMLNAFVERFP